MPLPGLSDADFLGGGAPTVPPVTPPVVTGPTLSDADFLGERGDRDRFAASTNVGFQKDPARSAKLIALQGRTGLPTALIDRNLDAVTEAARRADFNADEFRRKSPIVAQWISEDPARAGLSREDMPSLAAVEEMVRSNPEYIYSPSNDGWIIEIDPRTGASSYYQSARELRDHLRDQGAQADVAAARAEAVELRQREHYGRLAGVVAGITGDVAQTIAMGQRLTGSPDIERTLGAAADIAGASETIAPGIGGSLQRGVGSLFAQLPLLVAGGPFAKGAQGLGEALAIGKTLTPILGARATQALGKATIGAAVMQPVAIRGAINDEHGAAHALGSWAIDSAIAGAFGPVGAQRAIAKAAGVALKPAEAELSGASFLLKHMGLGASQNLAFDVAHRMHDVASGADPTAMDWDKLLPSLAVSGVLGAAPAALFSTPEAMGIARELRKRAGLPGVNAIAKALGVHETLRAAGETINGTQAMALNQEATQSLLQKIATGSQVQTLFVDAAAWRDHFGDQARSAAEPVLGGMDYDKAVSGGMQLSIPFERFLPLLNEEAHREWLLAEARQSPDALNAREAHEAVDLAANTARAEAQATAASPQADLEASADLVARDVHQQVLEAGRTESEAKQASAIWRAVFKTVTERGYSDLLPHQLYEQHRLQVEGGGREMAPAAAPEITGEQTPAATVSPANPLTQAPENVLRGTFLPKRLHAQGINLIRLLKDADRSTFLHESGHFFLEFMHDLAADAKAPERLKQDLATIRADIGAKEGEALTRANHEQFAKTFEAFVMEGKAPSKALRGAFARFAQWLKDVYGSLKTLKVEVSPAVREVMERLLATDAEIAAARVEQAADALMFETREESGMNEHQWEAYQRDREKGREEALAILQRMVMEPLLEKEREAYEEERAGFRVQAADAMLQEPRWLALSVLQNNTWPKGTIAPEGLESIKLDRGDIVRTFGEEALKDLPGPGDGRDNRGRHLYANEGGIPLNEAAQLFGFSDGADLWNGLTTLPDRADWLETMTDEAMRAAGKEPRDPLRDGTVRDEARVALLNDARFSAMAREAAALAFLAKRPATPEELLRAIAREQIDAVKARQLRPALYRVAMERASNEAVRLTTEARHATDPKAKEALLADALKSRQAAILQGHLFKFASEAQERANRGHEFLKQWDNLDFRKRIGKAGGWSWAVVTRDPQGNDITKAFTSREFNDDAMAAQAAAVVYAKQVGAQDIQRTGYLEQADQIREGYDLRRVSNAELERRESLKAFIQRMQGDGLPIDIPLDVVEMLGKRSFQDLTVAEQRDVVSALKNLQKLANDTNRLSKAFRDRTYTEERDGNIASLFANRAITKTSDKVGRGLGDSALDPFVKMWNAHTTVQRLAYEMDGFKDGGSLFETWLRTTNDANDAKLRMQEQDIHLVGEAMERWGKLRAGDPSLSIRHFEPAVGMSMSHWQRILVALNWGTAVNRERMMIGQRGKAWSASQVEAVLAKLDAKDMRFVQDVFDLIGRHWHEIKAKQERVSGIAPERQDAVPIIHPTGVYPGGYFSIMYDPDSVPRPDDQGLDPQEALQRMGKRLSTNTRHGFAKARTEAPPGGYVFLDPVVITRHLDEVAHDLAYHEVLIDQGKFLRDKTWRAAVADTFGNAALRAFDQRNTALAIGPQTPAAGMEPFLAWMRQGVNFAHRAFNLKSAITTLTGIPQVIPRTGWRHASRGMFMLFRSPSATDGSIQWIKNVSTAFRNRVKTRDKNIMDRMVGVSLRGPLRRTFEDVGMYFWNKANELIDAHAWLSAYSKSMEDFKGDHEKSIAVADQVVIDTQGSGDLKDLPQVMRAGGELGKVFTASMSFWIANGQQTAMLVNRARRQGGAQGWLRTGADLLAMYGVQAAISSAVMAAMTGKDEDAWANLFDHPGELAKSLAKDVAYTGAASFVILRDLADAATATRYRGPQGLRSMSILSAATQAVMPTIDAAMSDRPMTSANIEALARGAGVVFHLPSDQLITMAKGLANAQLQGQSPAWALLFGKRYK